MSKEIPALFHFPGWSHVWSRLEGRRSVIVHGPQFCGQRLFSKTIQQSWSTRADHRCLQFHLPSVSRDGQLLSSELADRVGKQCDLELKPFDPVVGRDRGDAFFDAFREALEADTGSTLVVIRGGRRGLEESYHALIVGFCDLQVYFQDHQGCDLTLLVLDDYSMYFYENWRYEETSISDLHPIYLRVPSAKELTRFLGRLHFGDDTDAADAADRLLHLTGGHHGLILEAFDALGLDWIRPLPEPETAPDLSSLMDDDLESMIEGGRILHELQRRLAQQPSTFCAEALRHQKARLFPPKTPDSQYLTELGILARSGMNRLVMCPGVISGVIEDMNATVDAAKKPTSSMEPAGELDLDLGETEIEDDDFLIVHISDLHVGPDFRFHLTTRDFEGRKKAHQLLREDLDQFGIRPRVDALVVSGDFVERGAQFDQFQRAWEVVEAIRKDLALDPSRVVAVAGNHDLDWQPKEYAKKQEQTGISRENYETFYRLLGKEPCTASLTRIPNRGSGPDLRILGLDSNLVEGPDAGGIGFLGADTLETAGELLRQDDLNGSNAWNWIVVHHHLFPATSPGAVAALGKRISTFANASELLYHARRWRAEMILHGHEHQPSITVAQRWSYPPRGHEPAFFPVISAGAGSFALGSHLGPVGRNHYYIIHRRKHEICFHSRILDDHGAAFTYHDKIRVPLKG